MNERLDVLAKQAAEYAIEFAVKDQELYIPKLMEKFAELIVGECINIACQYDEPKMSGPGMIIATRIETHFGVEE